MNRILVSVLGLLSFHLTATYLWSETSLPLITRAEFERHVDRGEVIVGRRIPAKLIIDRLSVDTAGAQTNCSRLPTIFIRQSQVEGDLAFTNPTPKTLASEFTDDQEELQDKGTQQFKRPVIRVNLKIQESVIQGDMLLSGYEFKCPLDLSRSTMRGRVEGRKSSFKAVLLADNAIFQGRVDFMQQGANRSDVTFAHGASFEKADFRDSVEFSSPRIEGDISFEGAIFRKSAYFVGVQFMGSINFREAQFLKDASFGEHQSRGRA